MVYMCCSSLVAMLIAAVEGREFVGAMEVYENIAKMLSTLPPPPSTTNVDAWRLSVMSVQLRVERAALEEEQRQLLALSRWRSVSMAAY
jgi:hypothetical protein